MAEVMDGLPHSGELDSAKLDDGCRIAITTVYPPSINPPPLLHVLNRLYLTHPLTSPRSSIGQMLGLSRAQLTRTLSSPSLLHNARCLPPARQRHPAPALVLSTPSRQTRGRATMPTLASASKGEPPIHPDDEQPTPLLALMLSSSVCVSSFLPGGV